MNFSQKELRGALGGFATGVAVVSALNFDEKAIGITINSFASVSLDPPLILWSLQKSSDSLDLFQQRDDFAVSVLSAEQERLSNACAASGEYQLDADDFYHGPESMPLIKQALVAFVCQTVRRIDAGDHVIYLASVQQIVCPDVGSDAQEQTDPLIYYQGNYRRLASF